jgi:acetylornithine deacetylase/succinyl-diaminopimelate desuccinylase-like protein
LKCRACLVWVAVIFATGGIESAWCAPLDEHSTRSLAHDMVSDAIAVTDFIRMKKEGFVPDRDIILALTADEEGGKSNGVDWLLKNHRDLIDAEYALNPDSGGVVTENGKPLSMEFEATEKLYADFQVTATNPGGHSSLPKPDNAIYHIVDALAKLAKTPFPVELNDVTREYFTQMATTQTGQTAADMRAILATPPDQAAIARLSQDALTIPHSALPVWQP